MENLFVNKKVWQNYSPTEMEEYQDSLFNHYRTHGFPYFPTDDKWRNRELNKLLNYNFTKCIDVTNKQILQSMHGLSLCWSFHPHHYDVRCNNMRTVMEAFHDDDIFRKVIAKRVRLGDNMSDNGIRKMLKIYSGNQCVSNFRPTAAAAIYKHFCPEGGLVYDMSSGFGGRALGAHVAGVRYIGVDPSTKSYNGVSYMLQFLNSTNVVYNHGSEERLECSDGVVDVAFTSPPYYNCEQYSDEPTQSYIKYDTKTTWLNGFLRDTMLECKRVLKPDGKMIINIANVKSYNNLVDDTISLALSLGYKHSDTWGLVLSRLGKGNPKTEPILVFTV